MRAKSPAVITLIVLSALLFLTRHHIANLGEVVRQYATFHKLTRVHPEFLYRYIPSASVADADTQDENQPQVPKILHQVFLTGSTGNTSSLTKYAPALSSCREIHPSWDHKLWTDSNATSFIREKYPLIAPHYESYAQNIQRANILRYALLHHYGGVYLDLDVTCLAPLDTLLDQPFLTPGAYPAGVNNAFIATRPGHKFLSKLLRDVPSRDLKWPLPYVENMLSTGCMYFSNTWLSYVLSLLREQRRGGEMAEEDKVFILATEDGDPVPHMLRGKITTPLFAHGGASSWHGWDAAAIVMIGKYYGYFAMILGAVVVLSVFGIWKLVNGRAKRVRERSRLEPRNKSGFGLGRSFSDEERLLGEAKEG